jgi:glycosyltransferase involved in cell wall biosynthesis
MSGPHFSVIIPTYNRARLLPRAIASVFAAGDPDFEIIVVDSASTDGTTELVLAYPDSRVRLIQEQGPRGVCPARNVGAEAAQGQWLVFLDSDDELAFDALTTMRRLTAKAVELDVAQIRMMCRWDDGHVTPIPPLREESWDYEGYVRFLEKTARRNGETMSCIRRDTFAHARFPDDRAYEGRYHLDFAQRYETLTVPLVTRLYHTDASDQNSFVPNAAHWRNVAPAMARSTESILRDHGAALRRWAPTVWSLELRSAAKYHFLCSGRVQGLRRIAGYMRRHPFNAYGWLILIAGLFGPSALSRLDATKMRLRLWRRLRNAPSSPNGRNAVAIRAI